MSKHLPAQRPATVRYVPYLDVAPAQPDTELWTTLAAAQAAGRALDVETAALVQRRVRQIEQREEQQRQDYRRWLERRAELDRQDRRFRSVLLGAGAVVGLGVLGAVGYVAWAIWSSAALAVAPVLGIAAVVLLAVAGAGVGVGRRCVTVISHWHE
ncbi:hypothetical protein [Dactylosporangium sp. NPDC049140]|uniref:hypothetical protein n=1 Tax=Dactylosporangium sp. NPDC049140 TaxID=3155647 RepID=UPI0033DC9660